MVLAVIFDLRQYAALILGTLMIDGQLDRFLLPNVDAEIREYM